MNKQKKKTGIKSLSRQIDLDAVMLHTTSELALFYSPPPGSCFLKAAQPQRTGRMHVKVVGVTGQPPSVLHCPVHDFRGLGPDRSPDVHL